MFKQKLLRSISSRLLFIFCLTFVVCTVFVCVKSPIAEAETAKRIYPFERLPKLRYLLRRLQKSYIDPTQFVAKKMFLSALYRMEQKVDGFWVHFSEDGKSAIMQYGEKKEKIEIGAFLGLLDVWLKLRPFATFLKKHYRGVLTFEQIEQAIASGMMSTLDKQTGVMFRPAFRFRSARRNLGEIGIIARLIKKGLLIREVTPDGPAFQAGLQANDLITAIDGEKVQAKKARYWLSKLQGLRGTKVSLQIQSKVQARSKVYVLSRAQIPPPLVQGFLLPGQIAYISLREFAKDVSLLIKEELARLRRLSGGRLLGLIFDLRHNPGGLVPEAVKIASLFLEEGTVATFVGANIRRHSYNVISGENGEGYPIVVLISGRSASASELVSGALKRHNRALIVGRQSYGKGTAQRVGFLTRNLLMRVTIAQYLLPGDYSIQGIGVTPDIQLLPVLIDREKIYFYSALQSDFSDRKKRWPSFLQQNLRRKIKVLGSLRYLLKARDLKEFYRGIHRRKPRFTVSSKKYRKNQARRWIIDRMHPLGQDFEVWFARYLLSHAKSSKRLSFFKQIQPLLAQIRRKQEAKIISALNKIRIDWRLPLRKIQKKAKLKIKISLKGGARLLETNQPFQIKVEVINKGTSPAYRVRAMIASQDRIFAHQELLFGRLNPGQSVSLFRTFQIPKTKMGRIEHLRFIFAGEGAVRWPKVSFLLGWKDPLSLRYRISYQLLDRSPDGNGDGRLQAGERVFIRLNIQNMGRGISEKTQVALWIRGVKIPQPVRNLGQIKAGQQVSTEISLRVPDRAKPQILDGFLIIREKERSQIIRHRLSLQLFPAAQDFPVRKEYWIKLKQDAKLFQSASLKSRTLISAKSGIELLCLREIGNFMQVKLPLGIYGKRVVLSGKAQKSKSLPFRNSATAWIEKKWIQQISEGKTLVQKLKLIPAIEPPVVRFLSKSYPIHAKRKGYKLAVEIISLHGLKDLFLIQDKKKVFYQSIQFEQPAGKKRLRLEIPLQLKVGKNTMLFVVRTAHGRFWRKLLISYVPSIP